MRASTRPEVETAFRRIAGLLPEAMLAVCSDGTILSANRRAGELLGMPAADLAGRNLDQLTDMPGEGLAPYLRACSRSRQLVPGAMTWVHPAGREIPCRCEGALLEPRAGDEPPVILLRLIPKESASNRFLALNWRVDDLTQEIRRRRRAERALHEQREWLRVTLESIGDAVIATDTAGHVTFLNPVAESLTGWSAQHALGRALAEVFVIVDEETGESVESPVSRVLREGAVVGMGNHTLLIRNDGTELPIADSAAPIRDEHGETQGVVLVFHDIMDRRRLERELLRQTESLMDADRRKDEFLATLAHELRNPLAPIQNALAVLRQTGGDAVITARMQAVMERQIAHLVRLVDDLLDVARITRGTIELRKARVALADVVRSALETSAPAIASGRRQLSVSPAAEPLFVDADATRLVQIVSNLLNNAAKYTADGGRIWLSVRREGNDAVLSVRDDGTGIAPDMLPLVFDMFTQVDRTRAGGLGIGLTLVRSLVQAHGGSVEAHSAGLGAGSEFIVRLPLAHARSAEQAPQSPAAHDALPARRVLVVDDNRDAADSLGMLLELLGSEVRVAHEGTAALQALAAFRPEVVFLDIGMPDMDGYEVARRMRAEPAGRDATLVAVTGWGQEADRRRVREGGFDRHLIKPVAVDDLAQVLAIPEGGSQLRPSGGS